VNIVMCFLLLRRNPYQPTLGLVKNNMRLRLIHPHYVLNLIMPTPPMKRLLCKIEKRFTLIKNRVYKIRWIIYPNPNNL